jgi:hypothetical protein
MSVRNRLAFIERIVYLPVPFRLISPTSYPFVVPYLTYFKFSDFKSIGMDFIRESIFLNGIRWRRML